MKVKITKNHILKVVLIVLSFMVSFYMYRNTSIMSSYNNYFWVPFIYSICLIFSINVDFLNFQFPGLMVLNFTMIVKYLFMPLVMCLGNYYSWLGTKPNASSVDIAVILTIVEMISIMIVINIMSSKLRIKNVDSYNIKPLNKTILHFIVIILGIVVLLVVPETFADHRFIFDTEDLATVIKVDFQYSGIFKTIFIFARYSFILLIIDFFYKRNIKRKSKLNVLGAFIPVLLNCLYTSSLSRISIFVPVLTFSIIIFLLFNDKNERRLIIRTLIFLLIFGITFMSALKFFGEGRGNENRYNDVGWWGDTLNMYFSGPKETAIGIDAEQVIDNKYGWKRYELLINDTFSNVIGLSNFTNKNNSIVLYNYVYFSSTIAVCQITPNIIEGFYYFGYIFCWIWPCIFVYLCFIFNKKAQQVQTLDLKFPYLYASIYCGMVLMINSSMIISNIINVSLLFILLAVINKKITV